MHDDQPIDPAAPPPVVSHIHASHSQELGKLASALSRVQAKLIPIRRTDAAKIEGKGANYSYKFAPLEEIAPVVLPMLSAEGIAVIQYTDASGAEAVLVTQLVHGESGQWIRGVFPLRPTQRTLQGMGSAVTYARRYCLCAIVGVVTYEDDDAAAAMGARVQYAQPQFAPQYAQPPAYQSRGYGDEPPTQSYPERQQDDFPPSWGGNGATVAPAQQAPAQPQYAPPPAGPIGSEPAPQRFARVLYNARTSELVAAIALEAKKELGAEDYASFRAACGEKYEALFAQESAAAAPQQPEAA